jgi:LCP family protein required for cell wall assembly
LPTVVKELSFLVGVPIQYFAAVDLNGFRRLVDAVGGVTVDVERPIDDPQYDWLDGSPLGFHLAAGPRRLDGRLALAYVRSRYGAGDNDFTRARRQQLLLLALRDRLTDPAMLPRLPELVQIAGDTIRTNFPADRVAEMLQLAGQVDRAAVTQVVLSPPAYTIHPPTDETGGTYILRLQMDAIARLSAQLFGQDSRWWSAGPAASPGPSPSGP